MTDHIVHRRGGFVVARQVSALVIAHQQSEAIQVVGNTLADPLDQARQFGGCRFGHVCEPHTAFTWRRFVCTAGLSRAGHSEANKT